MNTLGGTTPAFYLVRKVAAVTGRDLRTARPTLDENNLPAVSFTLNSDGVAKFSRVTSANVGRYLAIILDGCVQSAPVIEGPITSADARITGRFTQQEANDLSLVLRSGALPASLSYLEQREVGPSLGQDSIRAGITASVIGLALVTLFMLVYYRLAGINALVSVALNLVILMGFMAYLGAVMTLPGIAGFILTIGMGVDSNVLIFERIREELGNRKSARQAVAAGFDRVFWTIVDTHVASLIAAAFLFQFGTGPIRGFATTPGLRPAGQRLHGRVRVAHPLRVHSVAATGRRDRAEHLRPDLMRILSNTQHQFHQVALARARAVRRRHRCSASAPSWPGAGCRSAWTSRVAPSSSCSSRSRPPEDTVRGALGALSAEAIVQQFGPPAERYDHGSAARWTARPSRHRSLEEQALRVEQAVRAAKVGDFAVINKEIVGPTIGAGSVPEGHLRDGDRARRHPGLHRLPVPVHVRRRRHGRDVARHPGHARVPDVWFGYDISLNVDRGDPHDRRLLGQRHDRRLRPRA